MNRYAYRRLPDGVFVVDLETGRQCWVDAAPGCVDALLEQAIERLSKNGITIGPVDADYVSFSKKTKD